MDIFGTVTNAIDLAEKVITYVKEARNAFEESSEVLSEVSSLLPLLSILHARIANPDNSNEFSTLLVNAGLKTHLTNCASSLQHLAKILEPYGRAVTKYKKIAAKMKWPFKKEEVEEHLQKIERMKSLIMLSCQASLVDFVSCVEKDLESLNINVTATMSVLVDIEERQRTHATMLESQYVDLQALGFKITEGLSGLASQITGVSLDQLVIHKDVKFLVNKKKLNEIMEWLSPLDFSATHSNILDQLTPGTASWIYTNSKFRTWLSQPSGMLWCPGDPGVGKTFIASAIISYIQNQHTAAATATDVVVLFIDINYKDSKHSASELLRCLLKQFGKYGFTDATQERLQVDCQGAEKRLTNDEIKELVKEQIRSHTRTFLIIDALDEYPESLRKELISHLRELSSTGLSILITSRKLTEIKTILGTGCNTLDIYAHDEDMARYIKLRIENSSLLTSIISRTPSLQEDIISSMIKRQTKCFSS
ncbi:hypothetical protein BDQ17DRAFT_820175 [Cyathus striatus]|nr:hypothetical protein BDQ17DRAFT_820175 [Cyathus striatus]